MSEPIYFSHERLSRTKLETISQKSVSVFEFAFTNQIVSFEIPTSGVYSIECWGASGGGTNAAPRGAYSKSFFTFHSGEIIDILVGESGYDGRSSGNHIYCGGGGGGTFVAKENTPICVAGGGGALSYSTTSPTTFLYSYGQSTELGGNPGLGLGSLKQGGKSSTYSGGGGGFEGNGNDGTHLGKGGISFINGGSRQTSGTSGDYGYGGFGGGGSNHGYCGYAGGGGGYTGGSASESESKPGGGGGSYHTGSFNVEESKSISGDKTYPQNPSNNKNGFVVLTILNNQQKSTKKECKTNQHFQIIFFQTIFLLVSFLSS